MMEKSNVVWYPTSKRKSNKGKFLGTLSPVTGFMITADSATYAYTGVQAQYKLGKLNIVQVLHLACMAQETVRI